MVYVACFGVRVLLTFHLMVVLYTFSSVSFWKRVPHCILILVISRFGFEGGIWVLIAPVPSRCILVTFIFCSA